MASPKGVRWGWLKFMYIVTIVIAGGYGLGIIYAPDQMKLIFHTSCDPVPYGIVGSVFLAFGLLAVLGLRAPLKFAPVLLLQLTYKLIWLFGVITPLLMAGKFSAKYIPIVVLYALTVVGDLIAIPFQEIFAKESKA